MNGYRWRDWIEIFWEIKDLIKIKLVLGSQLRIPT
jgi:hypothetical protein